MAGHSHWATIKRQKSAADARKGQLFSKLARAIQVAVRQSGPDPAANVKLRYAIEKAREAGMPKDTIERAIKKGVGELEGEAIEEVTYEGYGPGGVAILVECATDNRNRTASEIRKLFEKGGGKMGSAGAVAWLFERKGLVVVDARAIDEDRLLEIALEAGAEDLKRTGSKYEITCDPSMFSQVQAALKQHNIAVLSAEIVQLPKSPVDVEPETAKRVLKLMEMLDDHDDVQNVYSNINITEEEALAVAQS
ncbi:MAG: YebC/PmpR family DNA-binding transcriptional regulator [Gemmatales bacterium]|nr:YebC/PmpR family DNA-binding transcriptional regulator [Gemmatales bacterium]MCS7160021.1 YebC/PmpR family DNA-binding transcriptional regulator [Gemmatales bacterium]MDW8175220.1 YebC/PmpR family DNA-binding transcriptional regulator [Gemmatales bacterium]MDW8221382.1 YebC/PmpR family DNA-binding transcriptional regulator [Gemmatales bacterium]